MTLAQLQAAIQQKGYGTDTAAAQLEALNGRYREVMSMHRWPFNDVVDTSLVTVVGTAAVAVSGIATLEAVDAVRLRFPAAGTPTETHDLTYLSPSDFRSRIYQGGFNQAGTLGIPRWWTQYGGEGSPIQLLPVPDRIYGLDLDYNRNAVDLAAGGDIPVIPAKFHDVLVWGAVCDLAIRERDGFTAQFAQGQYKSRLEEMERKLGIHQGQNPTHIRQSSFWDAVGRGSAGWGR